VRKIKIFVFILLIALFFISFSNPQKLTQKTVIILSFDGIRWDFVENVKGFSQIEKEGFRAKKMKSVFPSLTFPAHASIATGTFPKKHGIVSSVFLDKKSGKRFSDGKEAEWLLVPPIWVIAEKKGLKSAVCAWPLSEGSYKGVYPAFYKPYEQNLKDREIEEWVLNLIRAEKRPDLIMAWFHGADFAGHRFGPESIEYRECVIRSGEILESIINEIKRRGLQKDILLIATSDHGMTEVKREIDIASKIPKRAFYPFIAISGPVANIYVENANQYRLFKERSGLFKKDFLFFEKVEIPFEYSTGDNSRTGDFLAICNLGDVFKPYKKEREGILKGMHGYPPSVPDMCGIFFAWGKGVEKKMIEEACLVDICPTALKFLGINDFTNIDGKPLF